MADECGAWVYCVAETIEPEWLRDIDGVGGDGVRGLRAAGLTAAVTTVRLAEFGEQALRSRLEDLDWLESVARTHHRVVETVGEHVPVIPLRLATVYRGEDRVAAMMTANRAELTASLRRVAAHTEWGVKAYTPGGTGPHGTGKDGAGNASAREAGTGRGAAYLRQRREQLDASDQARRDEAASAEQIHAAIAVLAADSELRPPQDPELSGRRERMILNAAYLVDDERSAEFAAAVRQVADRHEPVRVELTGPWPPYSFALTAAPGAAEGAEHASG